MKKYLAIFLLLLSLPSHAAYVWKTLVCGTKFVQLVDTNSTDSTYKGVIINDVFYDDGTELLHRIEQGDTTTTFIAKNFTENRMVAVSHVGYSGVTAYVEYAIDANGQIQGDYIYGSQCKG